jgi:hypothetical protein
MLNQKRPATACKLGCALARQNKQQPHECATTPSTNQPINRQAQISAKQ